MTEDQAYAQQEGSSQAEEIVALKAQLKAVYTERNRVVSLLAKLFPAGIRSAPMEGIEKSLWNCVYVDTPAGQVSWHYHDDEAHLFAHLPAYVAEFDGHTTEQKYARLEDPSMALTEERKALAFYANEWSLEVHDENEHIEPSDLLLEDYGRMAFAALTHPNSLRPDIEDRDRIPAGIETAPFAGYAASAPTAKEPDPDGARLPSP